MDITYIRYGRNGWCYCFNILDVFSRKWAAYMFDTTATADTAIQSVLQSVSEADGKVTGLRLRTYTTVRIVFGLNIWKN